MDDERIDFDLNESLKHYLNDPLTVPCDAADADLQDAESGENLEKEQINTILDPIADAIGETPESISKAYAFDSIQALLKLAPTLSPYAIGKVFDIISTGFASEAEVAHQDIESDEQEQLPHHRGLLSMYGFLMQWAIQAVENIAAEKSASGSLKPKGRGPKAKGSGVATNKKEWDSSQHLISGLDTMVKALKLKLQRIFVTTSERDNFVQLLTRPSYVILENEQRVKSTNIRMHVFKVLCLAIKHHGHAYGAQTSIVQSLTYFEHLSEPMAEFLQILSEQYDFLQLTDEILKELCTKEYNANDTKGPKSVSAFISKLSQLCPRLVGKQMIQLVKLLDNESYTIRCAIVDVCGNLITDLTKQDERSEDHRKQIDGFFDLLEERFLDVNHFVRSRTIQVFTKLCDLDIKFPQRRQRCAELATRSLEDKSSFVRRNAIKLISRLVQTHPFSNMHGGLLQQKIWAERLEDVEKQLDALKPADVPDMEPGNETINTAFLDEPTQMDIDQEEHQAQAETAPPVPPVDINEEQIQRLQLTLRYYTDALAFIETLHTASEKVCQLLSSKNKSEVIEGMDLFVTTDAYRIETAKIGIRKMLRLVWTKGNSDEGKSISNHLIDCYKSLFFEAPEAFDEHTKALYIANNMISLTTDTSPAELTCLEKLLSEMMKAGHISDLIVQKLWTIYGYQKKEISKSQRRGAIIVLGMLALADPDIIVSQLETILRIGLGSLGRADLMLARYSCIALRYMVTTGRQLKEGAKIMAKLPNDHPILLKLAELLDISTESRDWYGLAEQAIGAIYLLSKHPDVLCTEVIRKKTKAVFSASLPLPSTSPAFEEDQDTPMLDADAPPPSSPVKTTKSPKPIISGATALSQLLSIVGHVAIKQIVHLEYTEKEFKRKKASAEKQKRAQSPVKGGNSKDKDQAQAQAQAQAELDELDLIGGTTEDDFAEAIQLIRERELLYGPNSLLAKFGPLVKEICGENVKYKNRNLQSVATRCMAKLMCVSPEYCEENLNLLITIMERSKDPTTRSNAVIALGDMAVCFNHLIDENTDFLYGRLNDKDSSVKRTCLMTLTFLILAGQVKVKGQLGEMAKCLEDSDKRIADLAKMFFTELAGKDNAVYNHFIDMFSLLQQATMMSRVGNAREDSKGGNNNNNNNNNTPGANLGEEEFKRIIKFLSGFIDKDKYARQLAEKLASRLVRCENEKQWNEVAYALGLLQHKSEEITKLVQSGFKHIQAGNRESIVSAVTAAG